MNLQPTLEDDLVVLEPLSQRHAEALYEVVKDPLIWEQHPCKDRYKKEVYTEFLIDSIKSKGALVVLDKQSGKVIGSTRFNRLPHIKNAIEIGWSFLSRDKWGGEYNKAMKKLMIDYAFNYVDHIIFYIDKENIRSQKAVGKLGAKIVEAPEFQNGNESDLCFIIGPEDWKQVN